MCQQNNRHVQVKDYLFSQLATQMKSVIVQVLSHSDEEEFYLLGGPAKRSGKQRHGDALKSCSELSCGTLVSASRTPGSRGMLTSEEGSCFLQPRLAWPATPRDGENLLGNFLVASCGDKTLELWRYLQITPLLQGCHT